MSLLEKQVASSLNENALNKRLVDNSYKAVVDANRFKETSRRPQKIIYGKSSLLDKIISSNLNENAINKRLEQSSYSAINGQRQEEGTYKPEGVQMLGQMGREKPLTAITKEMIQKYQEEEQARPFMVDGEARKYMGATYEPQFPVSFESLQTTEQIDDIITRYRQARTDINNELANIDSDIKETTDKIASIRNEINEKGSNLSNLYALRTENNNLDKLHKDRKKLEAKIDAFNYDLQNLDKNRNELIKQNALINQKNREEVLKYEQSLQSMNRNRLNLQQQPYESEYDYYKRLKEVEKEKFDPVLYKKYASNENTKQLKSNLDELFSDVSFKEDVLKNVNDEDKFMINKLFDKVGKAYLDEYGYNNTRLSPRMTAEALKRILNAVKGTEISPLQAIIKRNKQREIYADTIGLARDRQDLEARQAQQRADQQAEEQLAIKLLQARMKRRPQREIYADTIELARDRQDLEKRKEEAKHEAAANIQRIFRGNKDRISAALLRNEKRITARNAKRDADAKEQKYMQKLARAQAIAQAVSQGSEQEQLRNQLQTLAQAQALSKSLKQKDIAKLEQERKYLDERDLAVLQEQAKQLLNQHVASKNIQRVLRGHFGRRETSQQRAKKLVQQMESQTRSDLIRPPPRGQPYTFVDVSPNKPNLISQQEQEIIDRTRQQLLEQQNLSLNLASYNPKRATDIITKSLQDTKNKAKIMEAVKKAIEEKRVDRLIEASMKAQLSPTATELSGASTLAEQEQARLRKPRSDIGSTRAPYITKKLIKKEEKQLMKSLTPEERRMVQQAQAQSQTRSQALNTLLQQRGTKRLEDIREGLEGAKGAKGSGFRKPPRRQVKVSPTEKKKDRLRLVVAQIKAGNTNPKLIVEVNKLYKDLYDIDNAHMMLK